MLLIFGGCFFLAKYTLGGLDTRDAQMKAMVGKRVVVETDTLTILDYTFLGNTFLLSNGMRVGGDYVDKNVVK